MGVVHKLTPEVREFILERKQQEPALSCRAITALVSDRYKIKLSKSSANSIFKQAGLSMPVGRKPKPKSKEALPEEQAVLVRCIKVSLSDGSSFYLDGQLHTVWRSSQVPDTLSSPINKIKSYIENVFKDDSAWVLFFASGYESPTQELFEFIGSLQSQDKKISQFILYDDKLKEMEKINIPEYKRRHFVFGVWPWQFKEYIKVRTATEFAPFAFTAQKKEFYIAEAEAELLPPKKDANPAIKLRGAALKLGQDKNICLAILSNFTPEEIKLNDLAALYLNHWPNLEQTLQDFSGKIKQFKKIPINL